MADEPTPKLTAAEALTKFNEASERYTAATHAAQQAHSDLLNAQAEYTAAKTAE